MRFAALFRPNVSLFLEIYPRSGENAGNNCWEAFLTLKDPPPELQCVRCDLGIGIGYRRDLEGLEGTEGLHARIRRPSRLGAEKAEEVR
jgi:hypothetical protein